MYILILRCSKIAQRLRSSRKSDPLEGLHLHVFCPSFLTFLLDSGKNIIGTCKETQMHDVPKHGYRHNTVRFLVLKYISLSTLDFWIYLCTRTRYSTTKNEGFYWFQSEIGIKQQRHLCCGWRWGCMGLSSLSVALHNSMNVEFKAIILPLAK